MSGHSRNSVAYREVLKMLLHGCGLRRWSWLFEWGEKNCSDKEVFSFIKNWRNETDSLGL